MVRLKYKLQEEVLQMEKHRWISSEKSNRDLGQEAYTDWIRKYSVQFANWADKIPAECIHCGACACDTTECHTPFKEERVNFFLERTFANEKSGSDRKSE